MPEITKEQIVTLAKLQKIDIETARLKSLLNGLPDRLSTIDLQLEEVARGVEDEKTVIDELKKKYRAHESDVEFNLNKIMKSQEKLRSVKTNKEYQSTLKEIEDLSAINSKIEDEMLEWLEQIDTAENDLKQRKERYSTIVDQRNREKDSISREAEQSQKKLVLLESDRSAIAARLDPGLLQIFNHVKAKHADGVAIVAVKDAVCGGCNMNIPPQLYNEIQRRDSLKNCPNCERIIYWEYGDERSE